MPDIPALDSVDVAGRTVLVRADLNVPLDESRVTDDFRIRASIPTIERLLDRGGRVVVCSHLGRPQGVDPAFSMRPVSERLGELLGREIVQAPGVVGTDVAATIAAAPDGAVVVLENTRFEAGEKTNDPSLADAMAALADVFVLDAFGSAHRAHASTVGVAERLPSAAGLLLEAEVEAMGSLLTNPPRPFVAILGGAKVGDKLGVMDHLLPRVDVLLVGGGMCFTLLLADGHEVGASLVEQQLVAPVRALMDGASGSKLVLPSDIVIADGFAPDAEAATVAIDSIPAGWMGLDIGPVTAGAFGEVISSAGSVFWNGPMGVFEWERFRAGTAAVAAAVAAAPAFTVVGGGDSAAAIRLLGYQDEVSHLSSGGGAGLEMLEGKELPGVAALRKGSNA